MSTNIPIFTTLNFECSSLTNPIIFVDNFNEQHVNYTSIRPFKQLDELNLYLWIMYHGFELFNSSEYLIITSKELTNSEIDILYNVAINEFKNNFGLAFLSNETPINDTFYLESSNIILNSIIIHKNFVGRIKSVLTDNIIFNTKFDIKTFANFLKVNTKMNLFKVHFN